MEIINNDASLINQQSAISNQQSAISNQQNSSTHLNANFLSFLLGVFLVFTLDKYLPSFLSNTKKGYNIGYATGFTTAKSIVEKSTVGGFFKSPDEIKTISGAITSIKGNVLTIHSQSIGNPFDGAVINDRSVTVSSTTKIFEIKNKTPEAYQLEIAEFTKKKYPPDVAKNLYPIPYSRTVLEISTLKVGDYVGAISETNIKNVADFIAKEIQLQPTLVKSDTVKK